MTTPDSNWRPPSRHLVLRDDLWRVATISPVSYPEAGNEVSLQVEDESYWFAHRNRCIQEIFRHFPPAGTVYDIGGGTGYVASGLQHAGYDVALVEPGAGARHAQRRGVQKVIQATMEDAAFEPHALPAASAFDVLEHLRNDAAFLRRLREQLAPGGRFYCTVPAGPALWSSDDVYSGHFRRYRDATLRTTLQNAGFTVEFCTYFFTWLTLPVWFCRALPSRLHLRSPGKLGSVADVRSDHRIPRPLTGLIGGIHSWELQRITTLRPLGHGTSLLCVAKANASSASGTTSL